MKPICFDLKICKVLKILIYFVQKTTCQYQIKFITEDYLPMYKTLQLFTNTFTFNANKLQASKLLDTYVQTQSY